MRHYLRDRTALISGSHHLLELHQRGTTLQRSRQQQGLVELGEPELASALGCSLERWQQAIARRRSLQLASLDQPQLELDGTSSPLVEQLPDPAPPEPAGCCWGGCCGRPPGESWARPAASAPRPRSAAASSCWS